MPPKANKPAAPKKPTKPSAKSKTGNTACSQAASNWQLAIRGKEPLDPQTYATLAKCRAMTRTAKQADDRARMGYNLNEQGAAALKGRLQKRFDQGLITQKSRDERLKTLLQQRKEKQAAVAAKPVTQTVEKLTGTKAVAQRFENAENKFIEHAISHAGLTRPQAVTALNAMTKAKAVKIDPIIGQFSFTHGAFGDKAVIRRAAGIEPAKPAEPVKSPAIKSIKGTYHVTQHERNAIYQGFEQNAKEWKTQRKHYKIQNQSESGALLVITDNPGKKNQAEQKVYVTFKSNQKPTDKAAALVSSVRQKPGYGVARASAAGNRELVGLKMRDKGQVTTQPAFTLKQSSSQGGTGAGRSMGVLFQTEGTALDKAAQAGQKAPLPGQAGLFASENQTGKPPKYVLEAGFTTWKQVNKFGLNNIVKDAPSIAKAAVDPTRNKYAGGSRDWIENDIASRIVKMTRIHGNKQLAIKAVAREYELQSQRQQEPGMPEVYKSISSELYKSSDLYSYKLNSQSQPPKPFSRQGQLAPGRGTEAPERSQRIQRIRNKIIEKAKSVQNELRKVNTAKNKSNSPVWDSSYQKLVDRGSKAKARLANLAKATDNLKKLEPVKKVATGRGTEERKNLAQAKAEARKLINDTTVKVSSNSFYYNSHDPEKRAKTYSAGYTKDIQSNMRGQVKRAKTANDAKVILDVLKQHVTGMKTRIAAWANAESRTASWAVTGRGNFNSSRNSKRMDSAMNKSQEISDYSKGLENAVSRALLKKSDTGTAITRLAKIRTRLERRKSKLNSDKQIQTRTAVYSARGLDEFANATKEDRSQALKNSMGQLKQIDKDRKTILGRLKKITAAESNLKMQTRISRSL